MKKIILSVTAISAFSMGAFAQGTIAFNGGNNSNTSLSATSEGNVFINGVLDTSQDINAELLYSSTGNAGTFSPVVTLLLSSSASPNGTGVGQTYSAQSDIGFWGSGQLFDATGTVFVLPIAANTSVYFEVEGWTGLGATYANAPKSGITAPFQEVLTSSSAPQIQDIEGMPALNLTTAVPEPSTFAMAGVGLASMLIFRRRNK
jgi:hypothetical protein